MHCLVAMANRDGVELLTVVLSNTTKDSKWIDSTTLFDYGFSNFVRYQPFTKGEQVDILYITGNPTTDWVRVLMAETQHTSYVRTKYPRSAMKYNGIRKLARKRRMEEI